LLDLNASGADGEEAIGVERVTDGDVSIDGYQDGEPYRRTLRHVAHRIHVLHARTNKHTLTLPESSYFPEHGVPKEV